MNILTRIHGTFSNRGHGWWQSFTVAVNDEGFTVTEALRRERSVNYSATWSGISAACFKDGGLGSDVFASTHQVLPTPYLFPLRQLAAICSGCNSRSEGRSSSSFPHERFVLVPRAARFGGRSLQSANHLFKADGYAAAQLRRRA